MIHNTNLILLLFRKCHHDNFINWFSKFVSSPTKLETTKSGGSSVPIQVWDPSTWEATLLISWWRFCSRKADNLALVVQKLGEPVCKFWTPFLKRKNEIVDCSDAEALAAFRKNINHEWLSREFSHYKSRTITELTVIMNKFWWRGQLTHQEEGLERRHRHIRGMRPEPKTRVQPKEQTHQPNCQRRQGRWG